MSIDLRTVRPYQVADQARQRLLTIRERLAELEARRVQPSRSGTGGLTVDDELTSVGRARWAAEEAVRRAAAARRRVRKAYLHSAAVHDYVAGSYEVAASSDPARVDQYRQRAAWHRLAAAQDRLSAERILLPDEAPDVAPAIVGAAEGAR